MASPAALGSKALRASHRRIPRVAIHSRGLAAPASGSFQYETGNASGVKYASRDIPGATTTLAVVAKAGSRYEPLPGYSDALEKFAFKVRHIPEMSPPVDQTANPVPQSTSKRSALRITREAELLGGELSAYHSRESLVLRAKFLREDLPYFTELLGEIITKTRYASALTRNMYTEVH